MRLVLLCLAAVLCLPAAPLSAQPSSDAQQKVVELNGLIREASGHLRARRNPQAAEAVGKAEALLKQLDAEVTDPGARRFLNNFTSQVESMKKNLADRGVEIPAAGAAPANPPAGNAPQPNAPAGGVSFVRDVAPMLTQKCGRCHAGNAARGGFSLASYQALMRGANGLRVVQPRQGRDSRIVEVIESGDMPRGGARVTPQEMQSLVAWIDAGATYDGPNPAGPITAGGNAAAAPAQPEMPRLTAESPTGRETVSFGEDIAPMLANNCTSCHGANNPSGGLGMNTFARLLRGGDSGRIIEPGKGGDSLLVKKLKGTAPDGQRMPLRRPPLPDEMIAKVETWINEGARFDGPSPEMPTQQVAAVAMAKSMSHEQLAEQRIEQGLQNWQLANPRTNPQVVKTDNFTLIGNIPPERLEEVGKKAETVYVKVAQQLGQSTDKPLIKGKLTLFVFDRRFEYAEFGTMVERRELPRDWRAHYRYTVIDAYGALAPPDERRDSIERAIAEQVAGVYLESLGNVPEWFGVGVARAISAKVDSQSPAVDDWNQRLSGIVAKISKPEDVLTGASGLSDAAVAYYGFGKSLADAGRGASLKQFIQRIQEGGDFDAAFQAAFRGPPDQVVGGWLRGGGSRR